MDWLEVLGFLCACVTEIPGFEAVSSCTMALIVGRWLIGRSMRHGGVLVPRPLAALDGTFRVLIGLMALGTAILLAVARAAGRSHYRW